MAAAPNHFKLYISQFTCIMSWNMFSSTTSMAYVLQKRAFPIVTVWLWYDKSTLAVYN
jgi:hypothetical protein